MDEHAWCSDPARDEAVRAAEDGRLGPLPTLEEAIAAVSPLPGRVEGTHWADWERLRAERDAAIRERDEAKARVDYLERDRKVWALQSGSFEKEANALKAHVAELDAASVAAGIEITEGDCLSTVRDRGRRPMPKGPPPGLVTPPTTKAASGAAATGWLDEVEREALEAARDYFDNDDHGDSECVFIARVLKQLLARSTPPEVVLPKCEFTSLGNYEMGFLEAIGRVKQALAAAGVKVTDGNR